MSDPKGFINIPFKDPEYRDVDERTKDFKEVEILPSEKTIMEQAARCMDCGIPFCHGCGCTLCNLIPEWNELVSEGYWKEALDLLISTNDFPEFTGRICPALCEGACTVALNMEPVNIRLIEYALIEKGFKEGWVKPFIPKKRTGKKVAVVGSGPSGLAAAARLNRFGHSVTVFEKNNKPGGLLRYGIPDFKLDKSIVERRINLMKDSGIKFENNINVGSDISGEFLLKRFDAVCIACGAEDPRDLKIAGRELNGIYFAMDFLSQQNKQIANEEFSEKTISARNKNVVVIGGGDTGSDCVGTSIRQKARSVTQLEIMPKPPEERHPDTPWPLWPYKLRTSSSHKEGCKRIWSILSESFEGDKNNNVVKINTVKVNWTFNNEGMPKSFEKASNSESNIKADLVLLAMGFTGPKRTFLMEQLGASFTKRGNVEIEGNGQIKGSSDKVFAVGDVASGASLVLKAMNSGAQIAEQIDNYLK